MTTNSHPAVVRIVARWCLQRYEPHEAGAAGAVYGRHRRGSHESGGVRPSRRGTCRYGGVWATPGFMFVTTPLVRSTAATRVDIKTHPHTLNDVLVQRVVGHGWHSHGLRHRRGAVWRCRYLRWRRPDMHADVKGSRRGVHRGTWSRPLRAQRRRRALRGIRHLRAAGGRPIKNRPDPGHCPF